MDRFLIFFLLCIVIWTCQAQTSSGNFSTTVTVGIRGSQSNISPTSGSQSRSRLNQAEAKTAFRCPGYNGQFADIHDCKAYYNCWEGAWTREFCQDGLLFDGRLGYCNWKSAVHCQHESTDKAASTTTSAGTSPLWTSSPTTPSTLGPKLVVTFPTPLVSTDISQANQSTTVLTHLNESMSTTTVVSPQSGSLYLRRKQPDPKHSQDLQMDPLLSSKLNKVNPCPQPTGQFVDKQNCSFYYNCWKGDFIHVPCPAGLYFDDVRKYCNWASQAPCLKPATTTTTTAPVTTSTSASTHFSVVTDSTPPATTHTAVATTTTTFSPTSGPTATSTRTSTMLPIVNITESSTVLPSTSSTAGSIMSTEAWRAYNAFAPFNTFAPFKTMAPMSSFASANPAEATTIAPQPDHVFNHTQQLLSNSSEDNDDPDMNTYLQHLTKADSSKNVFNDLTYPPTQTPSSVASQPTNPTRVLQHPDSGTVVYVTNHIMTSIVTANRSIPFNASWLPAMSLNGSQPALATLQQLRVPVSANAQPFRCPRPYGQFADLRDCSAYYRCVNNVATRQSCGPNSAFDSAKGGCARSWDMSGMGCKMVREDVNAVSSFAERKSSSPVEQVERDESAARPEQRSPYGNILFSPQHVQPAVLVPFAHLQAAPPLHDTDAVIIDQAAKSDTASQHGFVASKAAPFPHVQKRWADNELDQDDNFHCPQPSGLFPHDSDCSAFWNCGDNVAYLQNCPPPLIFDSQQQRCEWLNGSQCINGKVVTPEAPPTTPPTTTVKAARPAKGSSAAMTTPNRPAAPSFFQCPVPDGQFPHPFDCVRYYRCSNWHLQTMRCPEDQLFVKELGQCQHANSRTCSHGNIVPVSHHRFRCPHRSGHFPDFDNCRRFFQCVNGLAYQLTCPAHLLFNAQIKVCDWPDYVTCSRRPEPRHGHSRSTPSTTTTTTSSPAAPFRCPQVNGLFNHPVRDDRYFQCSNGRPTLRHCPPAHTFVANLRLCLPSTFLTGNDTTAATTISPTVNVTTVEALTTTKATVNTTTSSSINATTTAPSNSSNATTTDGSTSTTTVIVTTETSPLPTTTVVSNRTSITTTPFSVANTTAAAEVGSSSTTLALLNMTETVEAATTSPSSTASSNPSSTVSTVVVAVNATQQPASTIPYTTTESTTTGSPKLDTTTEGNINSTSESSLTTLTSDGSSRPSTVSSSKTTALNTTQEPSFTTVSWTSTQSSDLSSTTTEVNLTTTAEADKTRQGDNSWSTTAAGSVASSTSSPAEGNTTTVGAPTTSSPADLTTTLPFSTAQPITSTTSLPQTSTAASTETGPLSSTSMTTPSADTADVSTWPTRTEGPTDGATTETETSKVTQTTTLLGVDVTANGSTNESTITSSSTSTPHDQTATTDTSTSTLTNDSTTIQPDLQTSSSEMAPASGSNTTETSIVVLPVNATELPPQDPTTIGETDNTTLPWQTTASAVNSTEPVANTTVIVLIPINATGTEFPANSTTSADETTTTIVTTMEVTTAASNVTEFTSTLSSTSGTDVTPVTPTVIVTVLINATANNATLSTDGTIVSTNNSTSENPSTAVSYVTSSGWAFDNGTALSDTTSTTTPLVSTETSSSARPEVVEGSGDVEGEVAVVAAGPSAPFRQRLRHNRQALSPSIPAVKLLQESD